MSSITMKLNMEVEMIFWSDVNKPCWLTTGDPASNRGRSSMAIKLDDTNDEKVWGQISIKESRMGEQNAWRGKTSLMYDACILAYLYMYVLWRLYLLSREFCACKWKVQMEKSQYMCVIHIMTLKRVKFMEDWNQLSVFWRSQKVWNVHVYLYPLICALKYLKNRVVVLIVHIKKNSSIVWTEFLTGVSKGKMQLLKLKIAVIWAGEQVARVRLMHR